MCKDRLKANAPFAGGSSSTAPGFAFNESFHTFAVYSSLSSSG
jgi:hypothetical protein